MQNQIHCHDRETFVSMVAAFVREGLTFNADAVDLVITLTGGF